MKLTVEAVAEHARRHPACGGVGGLWKENGDAECYLLRVRDGVAEWWHEDACGGAVWKPWSGTVDVVPCTANGDTMEAADALRVVAALKSGELSPIMDDGEIRWDVGNWYHDMVADAISALLATPTEPTEGE